MCIVKYFIERSAAHTSRKISTRNQLVCSFPTLSSLLYFCPRCLLPGKRVRAYITRTEMYRIHYYRRIIYIQRGVNGCIIHGLYIHIILFSPKRRCWRSALERAVRKNCASSALRFSGGTRGSSGLL